MKSQIDFFVKTSNERLNRYLLDDRGLERKGGKNVLKVLYNDTLGKREFIYDLLLSTLLPKYWGEGEL